MATDEQDLRLEILNTLLTTPHRKLDAIWPVHRDMVGVDPRFYVRLGAWYHEHGDVRDHKEMFVVALVISDFEGHRDVGLALLRGLPPYEVCRVVDFIHGRKRTRKVRPTPQPDDRNRRRRSARRAAGTAAAEGADAPEVVTPDAVDEFGMFRNVPRSLKTEVTRYLREREADPDWFDSTALVARKAIKRLYALLHVRPGDRAQKILFENDPPPDSRLFALRKLAAAQSPAAQAEAILQHQIPYRVASTVVRQMTPAVLLALIERMSPQELINNLGSLRRRGALDNPELKALVEEKLEGAKTAQRVSALKAEEAVKAAGVSEDLRRKLEEVADAQVKAKGRITRPTALLIDKSASMEHAIELGKRIGAMISAICASELFVYAFDTLAYPIERAGAEMADWERALRGITAAGATSCGVALETMIRKQQYVEQIVMITDEGENTAPCFVPALQKYRQQLTADPSVCIVRTPEAVDHLQRLCRRASIPVDVYQFKGDYYALPNLVPMLSRPSKLELLMEIMDYPLPVRKPASPL